MCCGITVLYTKMKKMEIYFAYYIDFLVVVLHCYEMRLRDGADSPCTRKNRDPRAMMNFLSITPLNQCLICKMWKNLAFSPNFCYNIDTLCSRSKASVPSGGENHSPLSPRCRTCGGFSINSVKRREPSKNARTSILITRHLIHPPDSYCERRLYA